MNTTNRNIVKTFKEVIKREYYYMYRWSGNLKDLDKLEEYINLHASCWFSIKVPGESTHKNEKNVSLELHVPVDTHLILEPGGYIFIDTYENYDAVYDDIKVVNDLEAYMKINNLKFDGGEYPED